MLQTVPLTIMGTYIYANGDSFYGEVIYLDHRGFLPHGPGTYWGNGRKYIGNFHMGWWDGQGILYMSYNNGVEIVSSGLWKKGDIESLNYSVMLNRGYNNQISQHKSIYSYTSII